MEISGTFIEGGGEHHRYIRVDEPTADDIYAAVKDFWTGRENQTTEKIKEVVLSYRKSNYHDSMEPVRNKLRDIHADCDPERPFSMIDFGGANGSVFYVLKDILPDEAFRYLLIDPYTPFIEDFRKSFADQQAIEADAEQFIELDDAAFEDRPYRLFFSAHVMYLIKPSIVRRIIERAAGLTDDIVLVDNVKNLHGELDKENPVIFDYYPEGGQIYFSHNFEGYFDDVGFEILDMTLTPPRKAEMKLGYGVFHARRR